MGMHRSGLTTTPDDVKDALLSRSDQPTPSRPTPQGDVLPHPEATVPPAAAGAATAAPGGAAPPNGATDGNHQTADAVRRTGAVLPVPPVQAVPPPSSSSNASGGAAGGVLHPPAAVASATGRPTVPPAAAAGANARRGGGGGGGGGRAGTDRPSQRLAASHALAAISTSGTAVTGYSHSNISSISSGSGKKSGGGRVHSSSTPGSSTNTGSSYNSSHHSKKHQSAKRARSPELNCKKSSAYLGVSGVPYNRAAQGKVQQQSSGAGAAEAAGAAGGGGKNKKGGAWKAKLWVKGRGIRWLGSFHTEAEAASAYDRKAWKVYGEGCTTNFGPPPKREGLQQQEEEDTDPEENEDELGTGDGKTGGLDGAVDARRNEDGERAGGVSGQGGDGYTSRYDCMMQDSSDDERNEANCRICDNKKMGLLNCCDGCPRVYHTKCLPEGPWKTMLAIAPKDETWLCHECLLLGKEVPQRLWPRSRVVGGEEDREEAEERVSSSKRFRLGDGGLDLEDDEDEGEEAGDEEEAWTGD